MKKLQLEPTDWFLVLNIARELPNIPLANIEVKRLYSVSLFRFGIFTYRTIMFLKSGFCAHAVNGGN